MELIMSVWQLNVKWEDANSWKDLPMVRLKDKSKRDTFVAFQTCELKVCLKKYVSSVSRIHNYVTRYVK